MKRKWDIESVKEFAVGYGFEVLDTEYDCNKKFKFKCICCGNLIERKIYSFKKNHICKNCNINPRALTYGQIKEYVEIESKSGCLLLETEESYLLKLKEETITSMRKINIMCKCGNEFFISLNGFKNGNKRQCNSCSKIIIALKNKFTYEEVKEYIEVESESGCILVSSKYTEYHSPLEIKCSCGNNFIRALSEFKGRSLYKCSKCTGARIKFTYAQICRELNENGIKMLSDKYVNNDTKIKVEYPCGTILERSYSAIQSSKFKCPHCNKAGYNRDTQRLRDEIKDLTNGDYELLSEYKTMNDKVTMKHHSCGNVYEVSPHSFIDAGSRCPICRISKGEFEVSELLKQNNVNFETQYSIDGLVGRKGGLLKFDFMILDGDNLDCLIEYDGEFHYKKLYEGHDFEGQVYRDNLKNEHCKNNGIKLIRIPYWEFDNIEEILINEKILKPKEEI